MDKFSRMSEEELTDIYRMMEGRSLTQAYKTGVIDKSTYDRLINEMEIRYRSK